MKRTESTLLGAVLSLTVLFMLSATGAAGEVPRINKEEVKEMMGNPDVVIVDIRKTAEMKIKGAVRENAEELFSWTHKYPKDKTLIFYCA